MGEEGKIGRGGEERQGMARRVDNTTRREGICEGGKVRGKARHILDDTQHTQLGLLAEGELLPDVHQTHLR